MRSLRGVGVLFSLLIVGVLGGLLAPLPAEAATPTSKPSLTINGTVVPLTWQGVNCTANNGLIAMADNYFLDSTTRGCWTVNGATFTDSNAAASNTVTLGGFKLGSVSKTNRARVIINDYSQAGEDKLKLTGITFQSSTNGTANLQTIVSSVTGPTDDGIRCKGSDANVTTDDCAVAVITLINTFDNSGGEGAGDPDLLSGALYPYRFYMNIGSTFLATGASTIGDRIRLIGTVCPTWVSHANDGFGCDVSNASNTYSRAVQNGRDGIGNNRVGIGNFGTLGTGISYLDSGVLTSGTLTYKSVPSVVPSPTPTIITSCRTNGSGASSQCKPTVRLDYIIWVQGQDIVWEQASPGGCGGVCNTVEAVTSPPKRAVLWCGTAANEPTSLNGLCNTTLNSNLSGVAPGCKELNGGVECVEAQTCSGEWCVVIQVDGTPPHVAEDEQIQLTANGLGNVLPSGPFTIKLDSVISGVVGQGLYTLSNLSPAQNDVLTVRVIDFGPFRLDNVVCSGGAICQTIYDGKGSNTKVGFTVTGWAATGRLLADLHVH